MNNFDAFIVSQGLNQSRRNNTTHFGHIHTYKA